MTDRTSAEDLPVASHPAIDEQHVVERYLAGALPEADEEAFEAHILTCDRCLDELEADERFRDAFHEVAGSLAQPEAPAASPGRRRERWAMAALLLLAVGAAMLLQNQTVRLEERLAHLQAPRAAPPWLRLSPLRADTPAPAARLRLDDAEPWALVTLETEAPAAPSYDCVLGLDGADPAAAAGAEPPWSGTVAPDAWGGLTIMLPARSLAPALYALRCHPAGRNALPEGPADSRSLVVRFQVVD